MRTSVATPFPPGTRLALAGVGALGSEVCRLLLEWRHPHLLLIDADVLEPRNLALGRLFQAAGTAAVGQSKARIVARLGRAHGLPWQAAPWEIADVALARLQSCTLLLSCTDSALARVETAFAARALGLPMLDAGVKSREAAEGRVTCFPPRPEAACFLCGLPDDRRAQMLAFALSPTLGCTAAPAPPDPVSAAPSTLEATAAALLRQIALAPPAGSVATLIPSGRTVALSRSPSCPWHALPPPEALVAVPPGGSFADLLRSLPARTVLDLPWPICLHARCLACGLQFEPFRRTALVRRRLRCPGCHGTGTLEPLRSLGTLDAGHALALRTPGQLGLPARHLYHRRLAVARHALSS